MIDLGQRREPFDLALPYGLSVTVKPLTTAGMAAAQAAARRAVEAIERQAQGRAEAGLALDGCPTRSRARRLLPGPADPRARGSARHKLDRRGADRQPGAADA
jgi:hypothetical protein